MGHIILRTGFDFHRKVKVKPLVELEEERHRWISQRNRLPWRADGNQSFQTKAARAIALLFCFGRAVV